MCSSDLYGPDWATLWSTSTRARGDKPTVGGTACLGGCFDVEASASDDESSDSRLEFGLLFGDGAWEMGGEGPKSSNRSMPSGETSELASVAEENG